MSSLVVNSKTVKELESPQTLLDTVGEPIPGRLSSIHTLAGRGNTSTAQSRGSTTQRTNRLTEAESINEDLQWTTGRVERASSRSGSIALSTTGKAGEVEKIFRAAGDNHGVELDSVRAGVCLVNTVGETLSDDHEINAVLRETGAQARRLLKGVPLVDGGQVSNLETLELLKLAAEGTHVDGLVVVVEGWVGFGFLNANGAGDAAGEVVVDAVQLEDDVVLDDGALDVGVFEADGVDQELLLGGDERVVEEAGLGPVVAEARGDGALQVAVVLAVGSCEEALALGLVGLLGSALVGGIRAGGVGVSVQGDEHLACGLSAYFICQCICAEGKGLTGTVAVVVVDRHTGLVDGQLLKVGTSVTVQLGVQVGEQTALEQRVIGEVDTTDDMAGLELDQG